MNREDLLTRLRLAHKALCAARDALKDVSLEVIEAEGNALQGLPDLYVGLGVERRDLQDMIEVLAARTPAEN